MSKQFDKYNFYSRTIRRVLLFTGLWPSTNPSTLYRMVTVIHGSASLLTCCALLIFAYRHIASLHLFFKAFSMALTFLNILQKMSCLPFHRQRLAKLHADLASTFDLDLNDIQLRPILLSPLLSFYEPSLILSTMSLTTIAAYLVTPLIFIVVQIAHRLEVLKLILPYPTWYPWQPNANILLYLSHYTFEIYCGLCVGAVTSSVDALFGFYIFQICGQLERIYGPIILWMIVTNAMHMCGLIYQVTRVSPTKAAIVVVYIAMKSMQTLVYGLFGTFLENEKDIFREAIYATDWPETGEKCLMTDVLIMMTYKPFVLRACSLSNVSIDMFVALSNTAISYYLMLRMLEEQGDNY